MNLNLATKITVIRIFMILPSAILYILAFFFPMVQMELLIASCVTFSILCITDIVDGTVARKTNTVSDLGKFLDPLADKVVVVVMLFLMMWKAKECLELSYPYASLVFAILSSMVVARELTIGIFRTIAVQKRIVIAADILGKVKTIFLNVGVAALILAPLGLFYQIVGETFFYVGAVLAIISGFNYVFKNKHIFSEIKEDLDVISKSEYDIKAEGYPPKFFDVLKYGVDGNLLTEEKVRKEFKIGSITTNKIFDKMEKLGYLGKETEEGREVTLNEDDFEKLILSFSEEKCQE